MKKQSNYRNAWIVLKLALKAMEAKKVEAVKVSDLISSVKLIESKYIKGGDSIESSDS